jgi:signal transduction histidine kinase
MSKSKEQCMVIISERLSDINKDKNNVYLNNLKESIKEITGSEHGLLWLYDAKNKLLKMEDKEFSMQKSILRTVLISKKSLYDNHLKSHKFYNNKIDNPLNINIKSALIVPILGKETQSVIGFILAINSITHSSDFQRYDLRSLSLLEMEAENLIKCINEKKIVLKEELKKNIKSNENIVKDILLKTKKISDTKQIIKSVEKEVIKPINKSVAKRKTKSDLESDLKSQEKKFKELEKLFKLKDEELKDIQKKEARTEMVVVEEYVDVVTPVQNINELKNIFDFLTNEVTYLSNDTHAIYTFLEVIKNSLYDKNQLKFIDERLQNSQLINNFSDSLYNKDEMPIINKEFQSFQSFYSVTNLYSKAFSEENITFNIFIDPRLPTKMISDIEKIKSIMVHLINNVKGLIDTNGVAELLIRYIEEKSAIEMIVKGIQPEKEKKVSNFFKSNVTSNSLTSKSSGLGLSVSSNLINMLGAKLKLTTEGKNEHSFRALIPVSTVNVVESQKDFKNKKPLKIGILVNEENEYAYVNLRRYLDAFSIDKSNIAIFNSYKKMSNLKISHFICFENMLTDAIDMNKFPSITILKYSDSLLSNDYKNNELYINSYYGMALQKILFPDVLAEDLTGKTLLVKDTFFTKMASKFKR